jgi:alkaline phosphatase D
VALDFVGASISSVGLAEAGEFIVGKDHPLRAAYVYTPPDGGPLGCAADFSARYGVRASLELQRTHDREAALKLANPDVSPHLSFMDSGGHGYGVVTASSDAIEVEFVCIPRPLERSGAPDGGPLRYRVTHRAKLWGPGEAPKLERVKLEGDPPLGA